MAEQRASDMALELIEKAIYDTVTYERADDNSRYVGNWPDMAIAALDALRALPVEQRMEAMEMKPWPDGVTHHERCWIEVRHG